MRIGQRWPEDEMHEMLSDFCSSPKRSAVFIDLKTLEYNSALTLQLQTVHSKIENPDIHDTLFFVEHPSVYTLGKRGGEENLTVSKFFLDSRNINVIQTNRGGNITYHGPGQAVLYPIINLEKNHIGVKDFVYGLEEIMQRTALDANVVTDRDEKNHGLWAGNSKIGSVGISIKKGISFHGLAMNIHNDLEPFTWINPCGLDNIEMTSLKRELEKQNNRYSLTMKNVRQSFRNHFASVFDFKVDTKNEN